MTKDHLLGVDLGTTATKAALYHQDGTLASEGRAEVPIHYRDSGLVEQDSDHFYLSAMTAVRQCLQSCSVDPARIAGISFASQMAGIGTIDHNFHPATHFDSWLDMRCQPYIEELDKNYGDCITAMTGCPPTCDHGPKILWWMHEQAAVYREIAKFVTPVCYVAGRLAGLTADDAFIDPTFLHFTALSDAQRGEWSSELCSSLGVDRSRLPRIRQPWEVIGEVQPDTARDFGLVAGTIIAAGCGDTAAGTLGAGVARPGMLLDIAGTASVLACCTDQFVADREHRALIVMRSVVPGIWNPLAYIAGVGPMFRWCRDQFLADSGLETTDPDSYDAFFKQASEAPPGCDGLLFSPHLVGRICPVAPRMRGAWIGLSLTHTRGHMLRAVAESVGYEYAGYLKILRGLLPDLRLSEARVIGGGSKNKIWNQIKSDILGIPYRRIARPESATWGSALIAGKASGLFNDLAHEAIATAPVCGAAIQPCREVHEIYNAVLQRHFCWEQKLAQGFENYG